MMRIGAVVAEKVPFLVGRETDKTEALDEIPGWVGDTAESSERVGRLGLGGPRALDDRKNRRFECYEGDGEPWDEKSTWLHLPQ
ncbi:uncharacterized protein BDW47DRAFT_114076 [Aspergillus candidus]|uniref:Uncharacterized protein n=1 Tax=Aspergillus candidus TaxID=41067 RepID=A0A2I2EYC0_ASPCN|nr:hypothetical protein BDW47DRAFT_114076 [Aspergillus candidus]PLB33354.1 hypothetical protein BDW47DRAFT_114076 [Aspergillus candidus]